MKIKYSPCLWNDNAKSNSPDWTKPDTEIKVVDKDSLFIDGQLCEFPLEIVQFDKVAEESGGLILEAKRVDGELYLTIRRFYTGSCSEWDSGAFHEV